MATETNKIATEGEVASFTSYSGTFTQNKCCTKARAIEFGATVTGTYTSNQLVKYESLQLPDSCSIKYVDRGWVYGGGPLLESTIKDALVVVSFHMQEFNDPSYSEDYIINALDYMYEESLTQFLSSAGEIKHFPAPESYNYVTLITTDNRVTEINAWNEDTVGLGGSTQFDFNGTAGDYKYCCFMGTVTDKTFKFEVV